MKDPLDPGTIDMACVWGELIEVKAVVDIKSSSAFKVDAAASAVALGGPPSEHLLPAGVIGEGVYDSPACVTGDALPGSGVGGKSG